MSPDIFWRGWADRRSAPTWFGAGYGCANMGPAGFFAAVFLARLIILEMHRSLGASLAARATAPQDDIGDIFESGDFVTNVLGDIARKQSRPQWVVVGCVTVGC